MQFTELTEEQVREMQFAGRERNGKNPYGDLLQAVKDGKTIQVKLEDGMQMRNLKWRLSQAAKRSEMTLTIRVLADQSGVVVSLPAEVPPPPAESGDTGTESPTAGARTRK